MSTQSLKELIKEYRSSYDGSFIGHRSTFLSEIDQLSAIQLSILLLQKQMSLNDLPTPEDLHMLQQNIKQKKTASKTPTCHLSPSLHEAFDEIYNGYIEFMKHCNMIDSSDVQLFLTKDAVMNEAGYTLPSTPGVTVTPKRKSPDVLVHMQLTRILIGYLQLLVNTCDEIALARIIDAPTRGINHQAFTDIRKLSKEKQMPMYQVVSSFVRQMNLGGKGYAPDEHHVLFKHKEGLCAFIEIMDELQTVLDDTNDLKTALPRLLKLLKTSFVRALTPMFPTKVVQATVKDLLEKGFRYFAIHRKVDAREIVFEVQGFLDYLSASEGVLDLNARELCGIFSTPFEKNNEVTSFKSISTLVTQFKTPDVNLTTPKGKTIDKTIETPVVTTSPVIKTPDQSPIAEICLIRCHDDKENMVTASNVDCDTSIVDDIIEESKQPSSAPIVKEKKVLKCQNVKKRKVTDVKKTKNKVSKRLKLVTGQKTLNNFFTSAAK